MHPRVLLAEDDDDLREMIQQSLEEHHYQVIPIEDGLELGDYLTLAHQDPHVPQPDLILADVRMPGKSALEVLGEIRPSDPKCPIVLMSSFADDETRRKAAQVGATMVLDKPVDPAVLSAVVEALLNPRPHETPKRLLIADDDSEMRSLLGAALGADHGQIQEASSGWELLRRLGEEGPFDLVVTDVRMPGPSGLQILASARTAGLQTPFLVITAYADQALREAARNLTRTELLEKPFEQAQFVGAVERLLSPSAR